MYLIFTYTYNRALTYIRQLRMTRETVVLCSRRTHHCTRITLRARPNTVRLRAGVYGFATLDTARLRVYPNAIDVHQHRLI